MKIELARRAGKMAASIDAVQAMVDACQKAIDGGYQITSMRVGRPDGGEDLPVIVDLIDASWSSEGFKFAMATFSDRLAKLVAELDQIESEVVADVAKAASP